MVLLQNYKEWCEWCLIEFGKVPVNEKDLKDTTLHPEELNYWFPQVQGDCYSYDLSEKDTLVNFLNIKKDVMYKLKTFKEYKVIGA